MLSVWFAAVHPPPIPLMPFLLAAGALGLSQTRFLISYCSGRAVRYGAVAWLGYRYGRNMIALWQKYLSAWTMPLIGAYVALIVIGATYGFWKFRSQNKKSN